MLKAAKTSWGWGCARGGRARLTLHRGRSLNDTPAQQPAPLWRGTLDTPPRRSQVKSHRLLSQPDSQTFLSHFLFLTPATITRAAAAYPRQTRSSGRRARHMSTLEPPCVRSAARFCPPVQTKSLIRALPTQKHSQARAIGARDQGRTELRRHFQSTLSVTPNHPPTSAQVGVRSNAAFPSVAGRAPLSATLDRCDGGAAREPRRRPPPLRGLVPGRDNVGSAPRVCAYSGDYRVEWRNVPWWLGGIAERPRSGDDRGGDGGAWRGCVGSGERGDGGGEFWCGPTTTHIHHRRIQQSWRQQQQRTRHRRRCCCGR
jgi:hypothetical protein